MIHLFKKIHCKILGHKIPLEEKKWLLSIGEVREQDSSWCNCVRCDRFLYIRGFRNKPYTIEEGSGYGYKKWRI